MSYVPKSVQRKLDAQNRARSLEIQAIVAAGVQVVARPFVPTTLSAGQGGAQMWDVFFNGTRQHLCQHADTERGYIVRYLRGSGSRPLTSETEKLFGVVEIKRKKS